MVMNGLVGEIQSVFVQERQILDDALIRVVRQFIGLRRRKEGRGNNETRF